MSLQFAFESHVSWQLTWLLTKVRAGVPSDDDDGRHSAVLPFTGFLCHGQSTMSAFIACKLLLYQNVMILLACYSSGYNVQVLIRTGSPGAWCCRLIKFHKGPLFIFISIILYDTMLNWAASLCFLGRKRVFFLTHSLIQVLAYKSLLNQQHSFFPRDPWVNIDNRSVLSGQFITS